MARVLIAYGTGEGQTARISEYIAQTVKDRGHHVEAVDIKDMPPSFALEEYDAAMIGASIHMSEHEGYVQDFVKENRRLLERVPSAFFSVSMTAQMDTEEAREQVEGYVESFARETGWHPERVGIFAGALPYTSYGFVKKRLIRTIAKKMGADTDISRDYEYTDWNDVRHFAEEFLEELPAER
jgi:menaquinone-dependent protoporphyrinogen oxidase